MKKFTKRLAGRSGFTIVECIIAIAVFAAMTMVVFMILTQARRSAVAANKAEDDLTGMIENVVGDDSYKKFYANDSKSLVLSISDPVSGGADPSTWTNKFTVSYNTVSGFKNYIECPECGYRANNIDFLYDATGNPVRDISKIKSGVTYAYICPNPETKPDGSAVCKKTITDNVVLRCSDCDKSGTDKDFTIIEGTGGYYCPTCGGTAVMGVSSEVDTATGIKKFVSDVMEKESVDGDNTGFRVSGMYANAIRYGEVRMTGETDAVHKTNNSLITMYQKGADHYGKESGEQKGIIGGTLVYAGAENHSVPGKYTLTLNVNKWAEGIVDSETDPDTGVTTPLTKTISIKLPPYYNVTDITLSDNNLNYNLKTPSDLSAERELIISNIVGKNITLSFRLTNYRSGFAFEYDYNSADNVQGLFKWFGCSGATPVRKDGYMTSCSQTFTINHAGYDS